MRSHGQSEWTLEAFRLREEARLKGARAHEDNVHDDNKSNKDPSIMTSAWTLAAFQKRENERLKSESENSSKEPPRAPDTRPSNTTTQRASGRIEASDWTLSAFEAREKKRRRDELIRQRIKEKSSLAIHTSRTPDSGEGQGPQQKKESVKSNSFFRSRVETLATTDATQSITPDADNGGENVEETVSKVTSIGNEQSEIQATIQIKPPAASEKNAEVSDDRITAVNHDEPGSILEPGSLTDDQSSDHKTNIHEIPPLPGSSLDEPNRADRVSVFRSRSLSLAISAVCSLILLVLISHFALPVALRTNYPDISLNLNSNSSAFLDELNEYVSALAAKNRGSTIHQEIKPDTSADQSKNSIRQPAKALPDDFFKITAHSRSVLISDPLNGEHYRLLGQLYELVGNNLLAYNLMKTASDLSSHEIIAHDYVFRTNIMGGQTDVALAYADRLFTFFNEVIPFYAPSFNLIISNDHARENLIKLLARNPHWRFVFFSQIVPRLADSHTGSISTLFVSLNQTSAPVTNTELKFFISALIAAGRYNLAHQIWEKQSPPGYLDKSTLVNNSGFDWDPTGLPFDWTITGGKEVRAQIDTIDGTSNRALNLEFGNGRITFPTIYQLLVLPPGQYRVEGEYKGDVLGKRGLFWMVDCYRGKRIGASDEIRGKFLEWRVFQFEIRIPDEKCMAQTIFLQHGARSPSEQILSGSISFDAIKVTRLEIRN